MSEYNRHKIYGDPPEPFCKEAWDENARIKEELEKAYEAISDSRICWDEAGNKRCAHCLEMANRSGEIICDDDCISIVARKYLGI